MSSEGNCKLGDFGSACFVSEVGEASADGSLFYMSPEMRRLYKGEEMKIDYFQSDVFSLGVTMLHLAKLSCPSSISKAWQDSEQLKQVVQAETCGLSYSVEMPGILRLMLQSDPARRPTIEILMFHSRDIYADEVKNEYYLAHKGMMIRIALIKWCEYLINQADIDSSNLLAQLMFAFVFHRNMKYDEYVEILTEMLPTVKNDTEVNESTMYNALLWSDLCKRLSKQNNIRNAEAAYSKAVELSAQIPTPDKHYLAVLYRNLGDSCIFQNKLEEAERMLQRSLDIAQELSYKDELIADALLPLGSVYYMRKKYGLAENVCLEIMRITKLSGEFSLQESNYLLLLNIYLTQNRLPEWKAVSCNYISSVRKNNDVDSLDLACCLGRLGICYYYQCKKTEAESLLQEALHIYEKSPKYNINHITINAHMALGIIYNERNRLNESEKLLKQTAEMHLRASVVGNSQLAQVYRELGILFRKQHKWDEAKSILLKALSIMKTMQEDDYLYDIYFKPG